MVKLHTILVLNVICYDFYFGSILTDVGGASALPIARGVIAIIAVVLFIFVVILIIALVTGAVMLVRKQNHSRRKKKSVLPSHAGVFTAMKSVCKICFN